MWKPRAKRSGGKSSRSRNLRLSAIVYRSLSTMVMPWSMFSSVVSRIAFCSASSRSRSLSSVMSPMDPIMRTARPLRLRSATPCVRAQRQSPVRASKAIVAFEARRQALEVGDQRGTVGGKIVRVNALEPVVRGLERLGRQSEIAMDALRVIDGALGDIPVVDAFSDRAHHELVALLDLPQAALGLAKPLQQASPRRPMATRPLLFARGFIPSPNDVSEERGSRSRSWNYVSAG